MEDDILDLQGMCKILGKSSNTVRKLAKEKKIPCNFIAGSWHSSRLALSMYAAGYNACEVYEKVAENVLKESMKLFV